MLTSLIRPGVMSQSTDSVNSLNHTPDVLTIFPIKQRQNKTNQLINIKKEY